jgi:hypothetical protein
MVVAAILAHCPPRLPAQTLAESIVLASRFAGCYELSVPSWNTKEARMNELLPMRFQLTMLPESETGGIGFVARNQDPKVHYAMVLPSWKADPGGSLALRWSTGYAGYPIRFTELSAAMLTKRSATELRGRAHSWKDTDPYPPDLRNDHNSLQVVAHRVGCQEPEK